MSRPLVAALAACLALLCPAAAAAAPAGLVVDGGSRGGRCSDARPPSRVAPHRPWCTVGHALRAAPAGSTVHVRGGSYPPAVVADVTRELPVTVRPWRDERPVIAGVTLERVRGVRLRGLVLTTGVLVRESQHVGVIGCEMALRPAGPATESGVVLDEVADVVVRGNWVHDGRDGVNVLGTSPPSRRVVIAGNHLQRLGNDGVHVSMGEDVLIASNHIDDVRVREEVDPTAHADGMQIMGPTSDVVVRDNRVTGGRGFLFMVSPRRIAMAGQGHVGLVVSGNVILGRDFGLRTFSTPGAHIVGNTVYGVSSSSGIDLHDRAGEANDRSQDVVLTGNVVKRLDVDPAVGFASWAGNLVAVGARSAADLPGTPQFVDADAGDFRLAPGSPEAGAFARTLTGRRAAASRRR